MLYLVLVFVSNYLPIRDRLHLLITCQGFRNYVFTAAEGYAYVRGIYREKHALAMRSTLDMISKMDYNVNIDGLGHVENNKFKLLRSVYSVRKIQDRFVRYHLYMKGTKPQYYNFDLSVIVYREIMVAREGGYESDDEILEDYNIVGALLSGPISREFVPIEN